MNVVFDDEDLDQLEIDPTFSNGLSPNVVRAFRKLMQAIRSASDERDLRNTKSFRLEKLKGQRQHQHSMRLNEKYRLIVEFEIADGSKQVRIVSVEDYH